MESFHTEFWRGLNNPQTKVDSAARLVMEKIGRVFSGKKHHLVIRLLGVITDPITEKRLKRTGAEINTRVVQSLFRAEPSRRKLRGLARRLQTIGRDLEMFCAKGGSGKQDFFVQLAKDCRLGARYLKYFDMARAMDPTPKAPRALTYKAFWKHLPIAMLCRQLEAPRALTFREIETLLRYAIRCGGCYGHVQPEASKESTTVSGN